ncbi:MAG: hypothetical protein QF524_02170 [Planctomycetota bacterium]|nr:hypothetical protein [Planctomycetota bacterium]
MVPLAFLATTLLSGVAFSQDAPEAWLSRLRATKKSPVEVTQTMTMDLNGATQSSFGKLTYMDDLHFRITMDITLEGGGLEKPAKRSMINVGDGTWMWMEANDHMFNQAQVRRMKLSELKAMAIKQGRAFTTHHPSDRILELADYADFESVELSDTEVFMSGEFSEDSKGRLINDFRGGIPRTLEVRLDRKTGFPKSYVVKSYHKVLVQFNYTDVKFLNPKKLDMKVFEYQVPEGVVFTEPTPLPSTPTPNSKK